MEADCRFLLRYAASAMGIHDTPAPSKTSSAPSPASWASLTKASYFDIRVGEAVNPSAAWEYRDPLPAAEAVRGRIGFWRGVQIVTS